MTGLTQNHDSCYAKCWLVCILRNVLTTIDVEKCTKQIDMVHLGQTTAVSNVFNEKISVYFWPNEQQQSKNKIFAGAIQFIFKQALLFQIFLAWN